MKTASNRLRSGVGDHPLVILPAVDGEVGGVGAMVADVAEGVAPDREACPGGFVAGTLIPVVADIYEGQLLGVLLGLFLRVLGVGPGDLLLREG